MQRTANSNNGPKKSIYYDREAKEWVFDADEMRYDKTKPLGTDVEGGGKVWHITPTYHGKGFVTITTPICFCSGLYVNEDKKTGKKTVSAAIWLYRNWNDKGIKKGKVEELHHAFWDDLHKVSGLLDTKDYAELRRTIGVGRKDAKGKDVLMEDIITPFVRWPKFREGHERYGDIDETRPPRVKANVWLAKPKKGLGEQAKTASAKGGAVELKLVPEGDKKEDGALFGQRLLCTFEHLDKRSCPIEELYERPFLAKFKLVWGSDFFGAYKSHQLKISSVIVCELLEKTGKEGVTDAERDDARNELLEMREDEDREAETVVRAPKSDEEKEEVEAKDGGEEEGGGEEEDQEAAEKKLVQKKEEKKPSKGKEPMKAAPTATKKKKSTVAELTGDD